MLTHVLETIIRWHDGADPGFPVGGGADPLGGAPTYDFVKFSEKLHEIEKILGRRGGGRAGCAPPKSATGIFTSDNYFSIMGIIQGM